MTIDSVTDVTQRVSDIRANLARRIAGSESNRLQLAAFRSEEKQESHPQLGFNPDLSKERLSKILFAISNKNTAPSEYAGANEYGDEPTAPSRTPFTKILEKLTLV